MPADTRTYWTITATDTTGTTHTHRVFARTAPRPASSLRYWRKGYGYEFPVGVVVTVEPTASPFAVAS
jgi:hypothetical protein